MVLPIFVKHHLFLEQHWEQLARHACSSRCAPLHFIRGRLVHHQQDRFAIAAAFECRFNRIELGFRLRASKNQARSGAFDGREPLLVNIDRAVSGPD